MSLAKKKKLIFKIMAIFAESVPSNVLISVDFFVEAHAPNAPPPLDMRLSEEYVCWTEQDILWQDFE